MSEPENFLSRWSRLKLESGLAESDDENRAAEALPGADMRSPPAIDPASLPPIESIVADTDIRLFLEAGVPAESTRAALRRAWAVDPSICDFIGIAEGQWDFNDPAAIAGFGPLGAADYARHLATRALANRESPGMIQQPASASADPQCRKPVDEVRQVATAPADSSHDVDPDSQLVEITGVESVTQRNASEAGLGPAAKHSHGSALPKPGSRVRGSGGSRR